MGELQIVVLGET